MGFWKKSSSLSSKGICEVLRFYPEVCVQRVSCLSMVIASSMLFPKFMVCRQTLCVMYCIDGFRDISLILLSRSFGGLASDGMPVFFVRVHPLHRKALCDGLL